MTVRKTSITQRILWPILLVMIVQAGIFYGTLQVGGVITELQQNAFDILTEKSSSRASDLQNEMVQRWANIDEMVGRIQTQTEAALTEAGLTPADIRLDAPVTDKLLDDYGSTIVYTLRKNAVTGAFIILSGQDGDRDGDGRYRKPGVYIRDSDPTAGPSDNSDLLAERAPSAVTQGKHIAMDSLWMPYFSFTGPQTEHEGYYYRPYQAALDNPGAAYEDLAYWSPPFYLNEGDAAYKDAVEIITYSAPLVYKDGTVYGVAGVEITLDYLNKQLPSAEVQAENKGGYLLAIRRKEEEPDRFTCEQVSQSGSMLSNLLGDGRTFTFEKNQPFSIYNLAGQGTDAPECAASVDTLKLYNTHTPFEEDQWVLLGVANQKELLRFSATIQHLIGIALVVMLVIGFISILIAAQFITRPIAALVQKLKKSDPNKPIQLDKLNIAEIDELSDAVQSLSRQVSEAASRLTQIMELTGVSIGAFEYDRRADRLYWTGQLFTMLMLEEPEGSYLSPSAFRKQCGFLRDCCEERSEDGSLYIFRLDRGGATRWVRLKLLGESDRVSGVFTDVTQDMVEKRKIEYDRDYDILTGIFNRRAFHDRMRALFAHPEALGVSALVMLDLDNLKYINDTYGHDYGDSYIRCAANALDGSAGDRALVTRLSGDEFVVFFHGYEQRDAIRRAFGGLQKAMREAQVRLPDQTSMSVRASAGVAWYPEDADDYETLLRYADFAMYMVKRTNKGQFIEFDRERYERESHLLQCKEELTELLENERVRYQFQPIVEARTGDIFAVEALIRPDTEHIKTPYELLSLARAQSKLGHVERLSWFHAAEAFERLPLADTPCKLFINSIANQVLEPADILRFERRYAALLDRLVVELTEDDRLDDAYTAIKQRYLRKWSAGLALDDFGSGYNGESILVDLAPDYVKLDIAIVRGVHVDNNRLQMLRNLVAYSRERNIRVIAEGVECREEMEVLIANGVDYLQGFYIARPADRPEPLPEELRREIRALAAARDTN